MVRIRVSTIFLAVLMASCSEPQPLAEPYLTANLLGAGVPPYLCLDKPVCDSNDPIQVRTRRASDTLVPASYTCVAIWGQHGYVLPKRKNVWLRWSLKQAPGDQDTYAFDKTDGAFLDPYIKPPPRKNEILNDATYDLSLDSGDRKWDVNPQAFLWLDRNLKDRNAGEIHINFKIYRTPAHSTTPDPLECFATDPIIINRGS